MSIVLSSPVYDLESVIQVRYLDQISLSLREGVNYIVRIWPIRLSTVEPLPI